MTADSRIYDILSSIATDNNTKAVELTSAILSERIEAQVRNMTSEFRYTGPRADVKPTN